jgi:hypothetical protein
LTTWASFEFQRPDEGKAFSSADNGAIHLALIQTIGFVDQQKCFNMYHDLRARVDNLKPYYKFVGCARWLLGPGRRWEIKGDISGVITIHNRFHGWALDGYTVDYTFSRTESPPFHHGIKDQDNVKKWYTPIDCEVHVVRVGYHEETPSELYQRMYHAEEHFAILDRHKDHDSRDIPRWNLLHCIGTWSCYPLKDEETPEERGYEFIKPYEQWDDPGSVILPVRTHPRTID